MERNWYCYLHIRKDTNQVFYVGIGCQPNFKRTYETKKRSIFWNNIVNKVQYKIFILRENMFKTQASAFEIWMIKKLGRRDLGKGPLVNLTDGGEGVKNKKFTKRHRENLSKALIGSKNYWWGKTLSEEHKEKIRNSNKGKMIGKNHPASKLTLDLMTGIFYESLKEASESLDIKYSTLKSMMQGINKNRTNLEYV